MTKDKEVLNEVLNEELLEENLLRSDFTFGFELEACADSDYYGYYDEDEDDGDITHEIDEKIDMLFNKHQHGEWSSGEMQHDSSIEPNDDSDCPFEWASPVMEVKPINFARVMRFLSSLKAIGIYTNESCGFHHHLSWKGITERDMIWTYTNLAMDKDFIDNMEHVDDVDMSSSHWASKSAMNGIRESIKEKNYVRLLHFFNDDKYRIFRIHPYGTIEWRGPRNFMNNPSLEIIKDFYVKFHTLIDKVIKCQNMKTIDGTDITKEEFFKNLKEAQKDENAPKPSESMRDNMEFLYRTGTYRGNRELRYKTEKDENIVTSKFTNALISKPELLWRTIKAMDSNEKISALVRVILANDYDFNRAFKKLSSLDLNKKEDNEFSDNLVKIILQTTKGDIRKIKIYFSEEIFQIVDKEKLFDYFYNICLNSNTVMDFINFISFMRMTSNELPLNKFMNLSKKFFRIDTNGLISKYGEGYTEYLAYTSSYDNKDKAECCYMILKDYFKATSSYTVANSLIVYDMIKEYYGNNEKSADKWNENLLGAAFSKPEKGYTLLRFILDTNNEDIIKGLLTWHHRYNRLPDFISNTMTSKLKKWFL